MTHQFHACKTKQNPYAKELLYVVVLVLQMILENLFVESSRITKLELVPSSGAVTIIVMGLCGGGWSQQWRQRQGLGLVANY